jgi:ribonuclease J
MIAELSSLRVVPLGGCGEFGRNLTVYDAGEALLAVDCGAQIPGDDAPGVDRFIPDFSWLAARRSQLRGWLVTHAHDDHLGALPWALKVAPAPVYARPLTLALLRSQLAAQEMSADRYGHPARSVRLADLFPLEPGALRRLGPFTVEALHVAHSIPDACALAISVGERCVVHSGDLKIEPGETDVQRLGELGERGVDLLLGDSTNATRPGRAAAESAVARALVVELERARRRVAFTLFSSNVERLAVLVAACARIGRRVCIEGRGLREMVAAAESVGALRVPAGLLVDAEEAMRLPPASVTLLCTGSQGEPRSALARIAAGEHPALTLEAGDTVVFSSRPVPGNERPVARVMDALIARGIAVVDGGELHASGHACQEELSELMRLCRPRALLPVHGGRRQLEAHAALAERLGIPALRALDGDVVEVDAEGARVVAKVPVGRVSIEGSSLGDVDGETLRARRRFAAVGVVVVAVVGSGVRVTAEGVASEPALAPLLADAELAAEAALHDPGAVDHATAVRRAVTRVFWRARGKKPHVIALV